MNLRQMEVFHAVMTAGSVTGAARLLNISQPAATNLLRHTEDQLKFKLFERIKGRLHPTAEAHILYGEVDRIFESVRAVRRLAVDLRETQRGVLDIVTTPSLGMMAVPRLVASFLKTRPQVKIRLQVRNRAEAMELVANQGVDLGIGFLIFDHPNITSKTLAQGQLMCILPAGHPLAKHKEISAQDIAPYPVITYTHTQGLRPLIDNAFVDARVACKSAVEVSRVSAAWSMVQDGVGLALVDPFSHLEGMYPDVIMLRFTPERKMNLELLLPSQKPVSLLGRDFAKHAKAQLNGG